MSGAGTKKLLGSWVYEQKLEICINNEHRQAERQRHALGTLFAPGNGFAHAHESVTARWVDHRQDASHGARVCGP